MKPGTLIRLKLADRQVGTMLYRTEAGEGGFCMVEKNSILMFLESRGNKSSPFSAVKVIYQDMVGWLFDVDYSPLKKKQP